VSLHEVITALVEHWDDTVPHLGPRDLRLVAGSIRHLRTSPGDQEAAQAAAADLTTVLAARLPRGHPVREAIAAGSRLTAGPADWSVIASVLRAMPDIDVDSLGLAPSAGSAAAASGTAVPGQEADARLLAAPALTDQQVRDHGNSDGRDLIRLSPADGPVQLPAFQFGPDGTPTPVVVAINRLLDAAEDPWGVADWWLGRNAWLDGIPAELLGQVDDALLIMAARAELPEQ
jgi:hypothetical protein